MRRLGRCDLGAPRHATRLIAEIVAEKRGEEPITEARLCAASINRRRPRIPSLVVQLDGIVWKGRTSSLVGVAVAGAVGKQGLEQIRMKLETGWRKRKKKY